MDTEINDYIEKLKNNIHDFESLLKTDIELNFDGSETEWIIIEEDFSEIEEDEIKTIVDNSLIKINFENYAEHGASGFFEGYIFGLASNLTTDLFNKIFLIKQKNKIRSFKFTKDIKKKIKKKD